MVSGIDISLDLVALLSLPISITALLISWKAFRQNRGILRVRATENYVEEHNREIRWLYITIVNIGIQPTHIQQICVVACDSIADLVLRNSKKVVEHYPALTTNWDSRKQDTFPIELGAGKQCAFLYRADGELAEVLKRRVRRVAINHAWKNTAIFHAIGRPVDPK